MKMFRAALAALLLLGSPCAALAANVWLHPAYDTGPQLVLSNSDKTMERVSGANSNLNLPFDSDLTIASGAATIVVSATFDGLASPGDGMIFGLRNASQSVAAGTYPGTAGSNSIGMESDGYQVLNNGSSMLISGGFSAGNQVDMEVNRGANTVRWRKTVGGTPGSWSATQDISALGAGTLTVWATSYNAGDKITLVGSSGGGSPAPRGLLLKDCC